MARLKRTPLKQRSAKRIREQRERRKVLMETFGPTPSCRNCGQMADDAHEVLSRARGGSITDPANIAPLCRTCHTWVTEHPIEAEQLGLTKHWWDE